MKQYGMPYMGSKDKIAAWVVGNLPTRKNFYDLFAGGCAITHRALLEGRWENYLANDLDGRMPRLFLDAINGKYADEKEWISREKFKARKDTDPYISACWSFGNNGQDYMYSKEYEPYKEAFWRAVFENDYSLFLERTGTFFYCEKHARALSPAERYRLISREILKNHEDIKKRYIAWYIKTYHKSAEEYERILANLNEEITRTSEELREYLCEALRKSGLTQKEVDRRLGAQMSGHYFGKSQWSFPVREEYEKMQTFLPLPIPYDEIYGIQSLAQSLQRLQSLRVSSLSYEEVTIEPDSIIYCDIPYEGTEEYCVGGFNHAEFYDWANNQKELTVISSYEIKDPRFECVASTEKRQLLCSGTGKTVLEQLYVPKHQVQTFRGGQPEQISLF